MEKDNKESMKEAIHRVLQETQVGVCLLWSELVGCRRELHLLRSA